MVNWYNYLRVVLAKLVMRPISQMGLTQQQIQEIVQQYYEGVGILALANQYSTPESRLSQTDIVSIIKQHGGKNQQRTAIEGKNDPRKPSSVLSEDDIGHIIANYQAGVPQNQLAAMFNISPQMIGKLLMTRGVIDPPGITPAIKEQIKNFFFYDKKSAMEISRILRLPIYVVSYTIMALKRLNQQILQTPHYKRPMPQLLTRRTTELPPAAYQQIIDAYKAGAYIQNIALHFNITEGLVRKILQSTSVPLNRAQPAPAIATSAALGWYRLFKSAQNIEKATNPIDNYRSIGHDYTFHGDAENGANIKTPGNPDDALWAYDPSKGLQVLTVREFQSKFNPEDCGRDCTPQGYFNHEDAGMGELMNEFRGRYDKGRHELSVQIPYGQTQIPNWLIRTLSRRFGNRSLKPTEIQ